MTASAAKIHHYVPQFVLRNFCFHKDHLWVFDKFTGRKFKANVTRVACEKGFYNFGVQGQAGTIEPVLSKLETRAAQIIKQIIARDELSDLDELQKESLSHFFAVQFCRTKRHPLLRQNLSIVMERVMKSEGATFEALERYKAISEDTARQECVQSLLETSEIYKPYFQKKTWLLFKTTRSLPFYMSDNPITLQNRFDYHPYGNIGLAVRGIEIYFPLTKTLQLGMYCPRIEATMREMYFKHKLASQSTSILGAGSHGNPLGLELFMSACETGKVIGCRPESVLNYNSLQVMHAARYLFSSSNDFSLAEKMIKERPGLGRVPHMESG